MSEDERTVELEASEIGTESEAGDTEAAVLAGEDVTTSFEESTQVEGSVDRLGRVVGLDRDEDRGRLVLTVETQDGDVASFALADPDDGRLGGRLRRLFHHLGLGDRSDVRGTLVPMTTVDGDPAIDWERIPLPPSNPSVDGTASDADHATGGSGSVLDRVHERAGSFALLELLLASGASVAVVAALVLGGGLELLNVSGSAAVLSVATLQLLVTLVLVVRTGMVRSSGVEE